MANFPLIDNETEINKKKISKLVRLFQQINEQTVQLYSII